MGFPFVLVQRVVGLWSRAVCGRAEFLPSGFLPSAEGEGVDAVVPPQLPLGNSTGYSPSPSTTTGPGSGYFSSDFVNGESHPFPMSDASMSGRCEIPAPPPLMVTTAQFWKNSCSRLFQDLFYPYQSEEIHWVIQNERTGGGNVPGE